MLSASLAREWWERKLEKRPSTCKPFHRNYISSAYSFNNLFFDIILSIIFV